MPKRHKDDCLCIVCQQRRKKVVVATAAVPPEGVPVVPPVIAPTSMKVPAGSLKPNEKFEFGGQIYRAGMKERDCILATNINRPGSAMVTIGLNTVVKIIK